MAGRSALMLAALCFAALGASVTVAGEAAVRLNPTIAGMADNTWIRLPTPRVHPVTRTSSPRMPYAPERGSAFLWGACAGNSSDRNDLWTYDLAANTWKQLLEAEPGVKKDPAVLKLKDGVLMTRQEKPLGGHQWGGLDYDPDRRLLWYLPLNFPRQGSKNMFHDCGDRLTFTREDYRKAAAERKGPVLWKYDPAANTWAWVHTQAAPGMFRKGRGTIRYVPSLRGLVALPGGGDRVGRFKLYSPDTNTWSLLEMSSITASAADVEEAPAYWSRGTTRPVVYDKKRNLLVIIGTDGTWLLDPVKKTLDLAISAQRSLPGNLDGPVGAFVYDSVGEAVLGVFVNYTQYSCGKALEARGFPVDRANVWALDLEKKRWVLQPEPADGVLPPLNTLGCLHHVCDPVNNVTMIFRGGYNRPRGETWVYRYKKAGRVSATRRAAARDGAGVD